MKKSERITKTEEALLARCDTTMEEAKHLHKRARRNVLWGCIFGAIAAVDVTNVVLTVQTGQTVEQATTPIGEVMFALEAGVTAYNAIQAVGRTRRANRHERFAQTTLQEVAHPTAQAEVTTEIRDDNDPGNFDLTSSTGRAMFTTIMMQELPDGLRRLGVDIPNQEPPAEPERPSY